MQSLRKQLVQRGYHAFLVPVFFVLHHYLEYYGLLSGQKAIESLFLLLAWTTICFFIGQFVLRDSGKSLLATTLLSSTCLFFGVIKDAIASLPIIDFASRYLVFLPLLSLLSIVLLLRIVRSKNTAAAHLFLNSMLFLFILADTIQFSFRGSEQFIGRNVLFERSGIDTVKFHKNAKSPDVYFLVFDSYPGSTFLKEQMRYDNSRMDSLLQSKGFYVINESRSNYNRTAFSIASTLNAQYLKGIHADTEIESHHYNRAQLSIRYAMVPSLFQKNGYAIFNLSIFQLGDQSPLHRETFLSTPETWVIYYNTLPGRLLKDVLWNFISGPYSLHMLQRWAEKYQKMNIREQIQKRNFNAKVVDSIKVLSSDQRNSPRFVYAHLYLPHPPFFFDSVGRSNNLNEVLEEESLHSRELFLSYLEYTNRVILQLVDTIKSRSAAQPIIIIQSDHGFRDFKGGSRLSKHYFTNYSAFHFPEMGIRMQYDSMSNVNTFPFIFNQYFGTHIPLLPDSVIYLPY